MKQNLTQEVQGRYLLNKGGKGDGRPSALRTAPSSNYTPTTT
jgi:hypothetical protein